MQLTRNHAAILAAALITFGSLAGEANAAVTITFQETGGNVVATATGSINLGSSVHIILIGPGTYLGTQLGVYDDGLLWISGTSDLLYIYDVGINYGSGILVDPSFATGTPFGFTGPLFGFPAEQLIYSDSPVAYPDTTWTWLGTDLASIGLGSLSSNPTLVYDIGGEDKISFVAVPEPSIAVLLNLGTLVLLARRRRSN